MNESEKKYIEMTQTPLRRQIIRLAIPVMICMLMNTIYNTADTYFVGRLGKAATGAVGIAYPAMNMITANIGSPSHRFVMTLSILSETVRPPTFFFL